MKAELSVIGDNRLDRLRGSGHMGTYTHEWDDSVSVVRLATTHQLLLAIDLFNL